MEFIEVIWSFCKTSENNETDTEGVLDLIKDIENFKFK